MSGGEASAEGESGDGGEGDAVFLGGGEREEEQEWGEEV